MQALFFFLFFGSKCGKEFLNFIVVEHFENIKDDIFNMAYDWFKQSRIRFPDTDVSGFN